MNLLAELRKLWYFETRHEAMESGNGTIWLIEVTEQIGPRTMRGTERNVSINETGGMYSPGNLYPYEDYDLSRRYFLPKGAP